MASERPRLYLHIGAGKAGSSAIQHALAANARPLRRRGVLVADDELGSGRPRHGTQLRFVERQALRDGGGAIVHVRLARLRDRVVARNLRAVVVSAENLINGAPYSALFQDADQLFDVDVILYVRRQDEYILATWTEWAFKTIPDFGHWLAAAEDRLGHWEGILLEWQAALPDAQLNVRVFDRSRLDGGDVVVDFLRLLGVDPGGIRVPHEPVNPTLNDVGLQAAMRVRHLFTGAHDKRFAQMLSTYAPEIVHQSLNSRLLLDEDARRDLVTRYADENERVRERYLPDLPPGQLFSADFGTGERVTPEQLNERELAALWTVVFRLAGSGAPTARQRVRSWLGRFR